MGRPFLRDLHGAGSRASMKKRAPRSLSGGRWDRGSPRRWAATSGSSLRTVTQVFLTDGDEDFIHAAGGAARAGSAVGLTSRVGRIAGGRCRWMASAPEASAGVRRVSRGHRIGSWRASDGRPGTAVSVRRARERRGAEALASAVSGTRSRVWRRAARGGGCSRSRAAHFARPRSRRRQDRRRAEPRAGAQRRGRLLRDAAAAPRLRRARARCSDTGSRRC